jgi:primosomal protein N' (replication factor Y)
MEDFGFASVILDVGIDKLLDYKIPEHLMQKVKPGMRIKVPVKGHLRDATIFELKKTTPFKHIKEIADITSGDALISQELFRLVRWVARYYCAPFTKIMKFVLPPSVRKGMEEKRQLHVTSLLSKNALLTLCQDKRQTSPPQAAILDVMLMHPKGILLSELLEKSQSSRSPVQSLAKAGVLSLNLLEIDRSLLLNQEFFQTKPKKLNAEQEGALISISKSLKENRFEAHLLHGITGSGKTEIYLQAIHLTLSQGKSALFLVPEIALTSQTVERLKSRFERTIAILHHRLSDGERRDVWHKIHKKEITLVVGARSAIFSPLHNLGLIIVDEEHDSSYKQSDEMPCYHGRDTAIMRAKLSNATIILGSATPSLESYTNAISGKYRLSKLTTRPTGATLPTVSIVDMRQEFAKAKGFTLFSEKLLTEIEKRFKIGEQTLLFLNRRGFHTSQICTACGHKIECPHCALSLTFHKGENSLSCHLCNYEIKPPPKSCPKCHQEDGLKYKGAGTEQVERALHALFTDIRTLRLDADTTRHKGSHEKLFKQFRSGKADILIGTQMIAKGLHFPSVTLVGVLNIDATLQIPDFRSSEQVFQLITQVSGRSGRDALAGQVIIQTHLPDNPIIIHASKQDYESFYKEEIEARKLFNYPPFSHLVKLTFAGKSLPRTETYAQALRTHLLQHLPTSFNLYPITPCGYAKIKDFFRVQLIINGPLTRPVTEILETISAPSFLKITIDVDPLSTYF